VRSALALVVVAGCYTPELAPCAVHCGRDSTCPAELSCGDDHFCHPANDDGSCARLSITTSGNGNGQVASSPPGIDCASGQGDGCDAGFPSGTMLMLSESPAGSDHFQSWTGDACDGSTDDTCMFRLDHSMAIDARFF
jgi:hypothetical protein